MSIEKKTSHNEIPLTTSRMAIIIKGCTVTSVVEDVIKLEC